MTGLAFFKQSLLNVVESHSDKISFLDIRKLSMTPKKGSNMTSGHVDNAYYKKLFGDSCSSTKGSSSVCIKGYRMVVNSLDNMICLYDLQDILNQPPVRYYGHRSSKEFYGKLHYF